MFFYSEYNDTPETLVIVVAEHDHLQDNDEIFYEVEEIIEHPQYGKEHPLDSDIALIKIKGKFPCNNPLIKPVRILFISKFALSTRFQMDFCAVIMNFEEYIINFE